jgi:hypothetical protein
VSQFRQVRLPASARALAVDRTSLALCAVFLLAAAFYVWTAATTFPLSLHGAAGDPYNQLADAFLHLRLSVGRAPADLLRLPEPYNPAQNGPLIQPHGPLQESIHDYALFHGKLFIAWGPAPVIVLLVPLHLLGFEPTPSLTTSVFAIVGLGFALATLGVVLRQIGDVPLWMSILSALTLALASAVPFILRRPAVYEEEISGGYCFAMAGIWLAISALADRRASLRRLALMSLCIGLAVGSRPTLVLTAVVFVPVYWSLRVTQARRDLLLALIIPVGLCGVLLLAYNQMRFGNPLENGASYQLAGFDQNTAHFGDLSYVPPGLWFYGISPPRATILFPFFILTPPPISYPASLPGLYPQLLEPTGGLLPMTPIVVFLAALPSLWRRRASSLGRLALPLLLLTGAGLACVLFLSYVFFSTTERYEVDFLTLFLLGAVAAWLALSRATRGWRRLVVQIAGGILATWSCIAGVAISFTGYYNLLATGHPGTWRTLQDITAAVSWAAAIAEGHPVLAEATAPELPWLAVGERDNLVIVSPGTTKATLVAAFVTARRSGGAIERGASGATLLVRGPGRASSTYQIPAGGGAVRVLLRLSPGLNRLSLIPLSTKASGGETPTRASQQLLGVEDMSLTR